MKDIDYLKEAIKEEIDILIDDIYNDGMTTGDELEYIKSIDDKFKETLLNEVLDNEELRLGIREIIKEEFWH